MSAASAWASAVSAASSALSISSAMCSTEARQPSERAPISQCDSHTFAWASIHWRTRATSARVARQRSAMIVQFL